MSSKLSVSMLTMITALPPLKTSEKQQNRVPTDAEVKKSNQTGQNQKDPDLKYGARRIFTFVIIICCSKRVIVPTSLQKIIRLSHKAHQGTTKVSRN